MAGSRSHDRQNGNSKIKPDKRAYRVHMVNIPEVNVFQRKTCHFITLSLSLSSDVFKPPIVQEEIKYCPWVRKAYNLTERDCTQKIISLFSTQIPMFELQKRRIPN